MLLLRIGWTELILAAKVLSAKYESTKSVDWQKFGQTVTYIPFTRSSKRPANFQQTSSN